jgi:hypothetical protein
MAEFRKKKSPMHAQENILSKAQNSGSESAGKRLKNDQEIWTVPIECFEQKFRSKREFYTFMHSESKYDC